MSPGGSDELDRAGQVWYAAEAAVRRDERQVERYGEGDVERVIEAQVVSPVPRKPAQRSDVGIAMVDEHSGAVTMA